MAHYDNTALRALVISEYQALAQDLTDSAEITLIFEAVLATARETVHGFREAYNDSAPVARIPAEVLAACFMRLPLRSRIRASHVCRSWRAAALAFPDVWSNISISFNVRRYGGLVDFDLLDLAVSRAGNQPVDLRIQGLQSPIYFVNRLKAHIPRLRFLGWHHDAHADWRQSYPKLEYLHGLSGREIGPDFLGGNPGILRNLSFQGCSLPRTCPALSTVVDLAIWDMRLVSDPSTFSELFTLFPRLESLQLYSLERRFDGQLPAGQAPASLRRLSLMSGQPTCDLMQHYVAWETASLRNAYIYIPELLPVDLNPFFRGASVLTVDRSRHPYDTHIISEHPDSTLHKFQITERNFRPVADLIFRGTRSLQHIHTTRLSLSTLTDLFPMLSGLPALKHLVMHVFPNAYRPFDEEDPSDACPEAEQGFNWEPLQTCLPLVPRFLLGLETLVLQVEIPGSAHDENVEYAHSFVDTVGPALMSIDNGPVLEVQGFPQDCLCSLRTDNLRVFFNTEAQVDSLHAKYPGNYIDPYARFPSEPYRLV